MVQLTCYGGVGQIGGNQFLLEDGEARLFFDFGTPYGQRNRFYEEYLKPRGAFGLLDPLTMGLLPHLRGLYRQDMEQGQPDLWDRLSGSPSYRDLRDVDINGVLVSHAHMDHTGYISFLRPDIPVITSPLTAFIAKAIQDSGRSDFESEVVYAIPKVISKSGLLGAGPYKKSPAEQRPFQLFGSTGLTLDANQFWQDTPGARPLDAVPLRPASRVGGLEVRCWPVDHSVPGASAFAVKTSVGWVAYTGDLRLHGSHGDLTRQFIKELKALRPFALLCEGTRADLGHEGEPNYTEQDVRERARRELRGATGLVIGDFGPRNIERLLIFADLAREAGRALVVLPRDAYLLMAANLVDPSIPSVLSVPDLLVYDEPRLSLDRWERAIRHECQSRLVGPAHVQQHQNQYVMAFSFYDLDQLPTIKPGPGSLYIYSSHEAFSEELQMDFRRLRAWLEHFGMRWVGLPLEELGWGVPPEQQGLHASGHADGESLLEAVEEVAPQVMIPIHAEQRGIDYFHSKVRNDRIRVEAPEYGKPMHVESLL